jgi:hypothetical protein
MKLTEKTTHEDTLEKVLIDYLEQSQNKIPAQHYGKTTLYPQTVKYVFSSKIKNKKTSEEGTKPLFIFKENKNTPYAQAHQNKDGQLCITLKDKNSPQAKIHAAKAAERFFEKENNAPVVESFRGSKALNTFIQGFPDCGAPSEIIIKGKKRLRIKPYVLTSSF